MDKIKVKAKINYKDLLIKDNYYYLKYNEREESYELKIEGVITLEFSKDRYYYYYFYSEHELRKEKIRKLLL